MKTDSSSSAMIDELRAFQTIYAFPEQVSVLTTEICNVMTQLDLKMSLPPTCRRRQPQHLGQRCKLLGRHILQSHLIVEDAAESQNLL
mmetsp:Transcript_71970/g.127200  ORF Transcript_71970/g.127200 Transcript_71970/m.127200 type:complete len:88 (+) Transcript_71970:992-1255(+)